MRSGHGSQSTVTQLRVVRHQGRADCLEERKVWGQGNGSVATETLLPPIVLFSSDSPRRKAVRRRRQVVGNSGAVAATPPRRIMALGRWLVAVQFGPLKACVSRKEPQQQMDSIVLACEMCARCVWVCASGQGPELPDQTGTKKSDDKKMSGQLSYFVIHLFIPTHCRDTASSFGAVPEEA